MLRIGQKCSTLAYDLGPLLSHLMIYESTHVVNTYLAKSSKDSFARNRLSAYVSTHNW